MINGPIRDRKAEPLAFPSIGVAVVTVMPKWQSGENDKFQIPKSRDTEYSQQLVACRTLLTWSCMTVTITFQGAAASSFESLHIHTRPSFPVSLSTFKGS